MSHSKLNNGSNQQKTPSQAELEQGPFEATFEELNKWDW